MSPLIDPQGTTPPPRSHLLACSHEGLSVDLTGLSWDVGVSEGGSFLVLMSIY